MQVATHFITIGPYLLDYLNVPGSQISLVLYTISEIIFFGQKRRLFCFVIQLLSAIKNCLLKLDHFGIFQKLWLSKSNVLKYHWHFPELIKDRGNHRGEHPNPHDKCHAYCFLIRIDIKLLELSQQNGLVPVKWNIKMLIKKNVRDYF